MSAMDSSSRNAGEMLDRLTLTYNRSISSSLSTHLHTHTDIQVSNHSNVECIKKTALFDLFWLIRLLTFGTSYFFTIVVLLVLLVFRYFFPF